MGNPIGSGLVMSLAHPGGNLTGLSNLAPELWPKRLELLKETVPRLSRIAMLWNKSNPAMAVGARETQGTANAMKIAVQGRGASDPNELESVFTTIKKQRPDGVLVMIDAFTLRHAKDITAFMTNVRLPAICDEKSLPEVGGLISYGENRADLYAALPPTSTRFSKGSSQAKSRWNCR
jgi:ABC-type uncharacterized transport system substrate-binding protein